MNTIITRPALQDLPCFQSQADDTFTTTNQVHYKDRVRVQEFSTTTAPKPPLSTMVDFIEEPAEKAVPRASNCVTTSKETWGVFLPDEGVLRAEEKCEQVATLNTESLERPMTTEAPITDIPTTAYFHGPMPDRAISQHFVSRRNTAAIIDGSGQNLQTVEVPMTAADPNFYFLRDGDGTRRTLEVRDETDDVDMRAHGRAMEELSKVERTGMVQTVRPLKNGGMLPTSKDCFRDPMMQADMIAQAQAKIAEERKAAASVAEPYGETSRIIIPHVFKHESGVMSVDRRIELMMQTRKQPENPPKATLSSAKDLIYSSAPPPPPQI